jgi:hypothetical protein
MAFFPKRISISLLPNATYIYREDIKEVEVTEIIWTQLKDLIEVARRHLVGTPLQQHIYAELNVHTGVAIEFTNRYECVAFFGVARL